MRIVITILILLSCLVSSCKVQQCYNTIFTDYQCSVTIPSEFQTDSITTSHTRWTESLVTNLSHDGKVHFFTLTNIPLKVDDSVLNGCVYSRMDSKSQFLIYSPDDFYKVIIDRDVNEIGTMGGGASLHPHPDGKIVVCLEPKRIRGILGVTLSSEKAEVPVPLFRDSTIYWTWH